jgi:hypothetical protein
MTKQRIKSMKKEYPNDFQLELLYQAIYLVGNTIAALELVRKREEKISPRLKMQVDLLLKLFRNHVSKPPETTLGSYRNLKEEAKPLAAIYKRMLKEHRLGKIVGYSNDDKAKIEQIAKIYLPGMNSKKATELFLLDVKQISGRERIVYTYSKGRDFSIPFGARGPADLAQQVIVALSTEGRSVGIRNIPNLMKGKGADFRYSPELRLAQVFRKAFVDCHVANKIAGGMPDFGKPIFEDIYGRAFDAGLSAIEKSIMVDLMEIKEGPKKTLILEPSTN